MTNQPATDPYKCAHCGKHHVVPDLARRHERTCPKRPTPAGRTRPAPHPDGTTEVTGL